MAQWIIHRMGFLILCFSFGLSSVLLPPTNAENSKSSKAQMNDDSPRIVLDETSFDFGVHPAGSELKHSFTFSNKGKTLLVIEKIKSSCGCTAAIASAQEIPPGESGRIDVTFKPGNARGTFAKHVTVMSNDPMNPAAVIEISATVKVILAAEPERLHFPRVKPDSTAEIQLAITGEELPAASITRIFIETTSGKEPGTQPKEKVADAITWKMIDDRKQEDPSYKLTVILNTASMKPGIYERKMIVETTSKVVPRVEIPVFFEITGPLTYDPRVVHLTRVAPDAHPARSVTITSANGQPFKILDASIDDPEFDINLNSKEAAAIQSLTIVMKEGFRKEQITIDLIVTTDNPEMSEVRIPIVARGRIPGQTKSGPINSLTDVAGSK